MDNESKISQNNQEKLDFFLISTHELRSSLSAMKWMFKMILDGDFGELNKTQTEILSQAKEANERLITLVNDTMTVMKSKDSTVPYLKEPVSLNELVEESIRDFTTEAAHKGMRIQYDAPSASLLVSGDSDKLRIVFHNLFENAIKYGDNSTDIEISLKAESEKAVFKITNKGVIIPPEDHGNIFHKFFRASTVSKEHPGIGLGLYATHHIVLKHGGTISFTSDPEHGTTFVLELSLI